MKNLPIIFWGCELVAAIAFLVGATIQIHAILLLGPILVIVGLTLALLTARLRSWRTLIFALSGPMVTALVALVIGLFNLGPHEAQKPVVALLSVYMVALLPLAGFTFMKIYRWEGAPADVAPPWQFSLRTLLIVMTGVCLVAASVKLMSDAAYLGELLIFGGFAMVVVALCAVVVWRFIATRKRVPLSKSDSQENL